MTNQSRISVPVTAFALLLAGACAPRAMASGFQLREQSASAQGTAYAGVAASGSDISSMFFNPATLTAFDGFQLVVGGTLVAPKAQMNDAAGTHAQLPLPGGGTGITGSTSTGNAPQSAILPEVYAMWSVSKDFKLGFSLNAPFGLVTKYADDFPGRYHAVNSELRTVDLALNAAYQIHPMLSIGATVLSRHVNAELSNDVDFGEIAYLGLAKMGSPYASSFAPGKNDGRATVNGTDNVLGYKLGLVFQPLPQFRVGLAYQSGTKVNVSGTVSYDYPNVGPLAPVLTGVAQAGHLVNGSASATVNLPDTTSLGLSWDVTPRFNLAFEADQTGWSKFQELRVQFGSGQGDDVTQENWHNTMFYSLGGTWKATSALTLRAGVATDQGAVDNAYRTPRIPDSDRVWMSVGAGYAFTKAFGIDLAYTHITVKDGPMSLKAGVDPNNSSFFRGDLSGTFNSNINIVALQARFTF